MVRPWFTDKNFTSLVIVKDVSLEDHTVVKSITITDQEYVGKLAARIGQIPPDGDMMKSFAGDAERIKLNFFTGGGDEIQGIDIIRKRFKTPSTGFHSINEYEKELYAEIDALLFPAIGKIVPKVKDLSMDFGGFFLSYKGTRFEDHAPESLSFHIAEFTFSDKKGNARLIEISAGQLPPKPFTVEAGNLTILTFHSKDGKRIYPDFFQVVDE